jgi:hypothetical protein
MERRIARDITANRAPFHLRLFRDGLAQKLTEKKLVVETRLTESCLDDYKIILKRTIIHFVSYPWDLCTPREVSLSRQRIP